MNKLTIRNKGGSYTSFEVKVNDVDLAQLANYIVLAFEPASVPVLKVEIPIGEIDGVIDDISGFVIETDESDDSYGLSYCNQRIDFDRRKADIQAEINNQKEIMK